MVSIYLSDETLRQNTNGILQMHTKTNQREHNRYPASQPRHKFSTGQAFWLERHSDTSAIGKVQIKTQEVALMLTLVSASKVQTPRAVTQLRSVKATHLLEECLGGPACSVKSLHFWLNQRKTVSHAQSDCLHLFTAASSVQWLNRSIDSCPT